MALKFDPRNGVYACSDCHIEHDGGYGGFRKPGISGPLWKALLEKRPADFEFLASFNAVRLMQEPKKMYKHDLVEQLESLKALIKKLDVKDGKDS